MANDIGTGATLVGDTSAWAYEITSVNWSGLANAAINVSHLGTTGGHDYKKGDVYEPGSFEIEGHLDPSMDDVPTYNEAAETWTLTLPLQSGDATAATIAASGFLTDFAATVPLEDKMGFTATLKLSGDLTITAASV